MQLKQSDYVLGHTDREQLRLIRQAQILAPATEHFLRDAGIESGMRVLDIGCGVGDVTMLVAQLVGPQGKVTSIDLDEASIATARKRTSAVGLGNTTFHRADILTFADAEPFDAIVGRFVLEFVPEPAATVSRLCGLLRPGGIMAFQEPSWDIWLAHTSHLPLRMAVTTILRDAFVASGANTEMELPLYRGVMAAKLTSPQLRLVLPTGDTPEFRGLLYDLLLAVWGRAEELRLPLESLGDPTTLAARLDDELDAYKSFASFVCLVGMFARKRAD
jgi:2-polyprenyl-3-methyl-5-hydroxy-6-metoxy-1,4-benzoquinol methylase